MFPRDARPDEIKTRRHFPWIDRDPIYPPTRPCLSSQSSRKPIKHVVHVLPFFFVSTGSMGPFDTVTSNILFFLLYGVLWFMRFLCRKSRGGFPVVQCVLDGSTICVTEHVRPAVCEKKGATHLTRNRYPPPGKKQTHTKKKGLCKLYKRLFVVCEQHLDGCAGNRSIVSESLHRIKRQEQIGRKHTKINNQFQPRICD